VDSRRRGIIPFATVNSIDTGRTGGAPSTLARLGPLALYAYGAVAIVLDAMDANPGGLRLPAAAIALLAADLAAGLLGLRNVRAAHLPRETRRLWRLLTYSIWILFLGHVLWYWQSLLLGRTRISPWFEVPFFFHYPFVLAAILSLPLALRSAEDRRRFWLDAATVVVAGAVGIWYAVLYPGATPATRDPIAAAAALLYLVGDLILLLGLVTIWLRQGSILQERGLALLGASFLVNLLTNLAYVFEVRAGLFRSGGTLSAFWVLAEALLASSAAADYARSPAGPPSSSLAPRPPSLLPYVGVAFGYGLLVFGVVRHGREPVTGLVAGAVLLTAVVVARQVTAVRENLRLQAEAADRRGELRLGSLVQHSSDVISILDPDGVFRFASPAVSRVVGRSPKELLGTAFVDLVHPADRDAALRLLKEPGDASSAPAGWRLLHGTGAWVFTENIVTNLLAEPAVRGLVVNTRDVSEKRRLEEQLTWQAFHDPLTRLPNRSVFLDRVTHSLSRRTRAGGSMAVLFVDLDNFKLVNDAMGHAEGDRVLVSAAERLIGCVRSEDTVARFGGDEFAILIDDGSDSQGLEEVAKRIVEALAVPFEIQGQEQRIGASVGIARSRPGETPAELLRKADEAMYFAKANGKGRYEMFALEMHAAVWGRLESEKELRRAIEAEEFCLYYQPILRLKDRSLVGFEALLRWNHPVRGLLAPDAFVPLAEETGLIVPIGRFVLREACRQWRVWFDAHPVPGLRVSVNASARHFQDVSLVTDVGAILLEFGLPPSALVLEITESLLLQQTEATREKLRELKTLGLQLAVDDFGTGYSSLGYLHRFPLDILKIDKTFVEGIGTGSGAPAIARAIVGLAQALHLETVAEGIETEAQCSALLALGCAQGQGYVFARPQPAAALEAFLEGVAVQVEGREEP
jgi:diguanylate cyclase (GGDEF)-like protein/PAS domain S-box-containing protein